jgi:hypothetical protein
MSVSIGTSTNDKSVLSAEDLLFIAQNPEKLAEIHADLVALRSARAAVAKREIAVEARERIAADAIAEADRVKVDFQRRAAKLDGFLRASE